MTSSIDTTSNNHTTSNNDTTSKNDMTTNSSKVRWGILSTSDFARKRFIPGMRRAGLVDLAAVASRSRDSAHAYAAELGIPTAYGSYEELIADPTIEAIYNPLPNTMHVEWTAKAAAAGKHVLCEKPMAMNAAELETLRPYASQVHLAEAFMVSIHSGSRSGIGFVEVISVGSPMHMLRSLTQTSRPATFGIDMMLAAAPSTTSGAIALLPPAGSSKPMWSEHSHCSIAPRTSAPIG
jgi:hypothetical protein